MLERAGRRPGLALQSLPTTERLVRATLTDLVDLELRTGDAVAARRNALEALELRRKAGNPAVIAHALLGLAGVELVEGSYVDAAAHATGAAELMESSGSTRGDVLPGSHKPSLCCSAVVVTTRHVSSSRTRRPTPG
jgi:hypothetical protein